VSNLLSRAEAKLTSTPPALSGRVGVLFANADWTVSEDGLEHRNGYFIERDAVAHRRGDGVWIWPLHMAEKLWCDGERFREAFSAAIQAYGLTFDAALALAFAEGAGPQGPAEIPIPYDLRRTPGPSAERRAGAGDVRRGAVAARLVLAEAA
jgi:hypothetical protein